MWLPLLNHQIVDVFVIKLLPVCFIILSFSLETRMLVFNCFAYPNLDILALTNKVFLICFYCDMSHIMKEHIFSFQYTRVHLWFRINNSIKKVCYGLGGKLG